MHTLVLQGASRCSPPWSRRRPADAGAAAQRHYYRMFASLEVRTTARGDFGAQAARRHGLHAVAGDHIRKGNLGVNLAEDHGRGTGSLQGNAHLSTLAPGRLGQTPSDPLSAGSQDLVGSSSADDAGGRSSTGSGVHMMWASGASTRRSLLRVESAGELFQFAGCFLAVLGSTRSTIRYQPGTYFEFDGA